MQAFTYYVPTRRVFGPGTEGSVGKEVRAAGGSRILILYGGGSAVRSGLLDRVLDSLQAEGVAHFLKGGVQPNPLLRYALEISAEYRDKGIDLVLAVGGGSVIDTAKAVALGLAGPADTIENAFAGKAAEEDALPVGVVLTIAASGSETSAVSVLTDDRTHEKLVYEHPCLLPRFAIMNPELTYTTPPLPTACGTADIMMHTIERYFAPVDGNAATDALAEALLRTVIRFGPVALERPEDYEARSELMWCGSLSHTGLTGLGRPSDFSIHQLGHGLSGRYGVPHGMSLTILWQAWAETVWETDPARFARLGRTVFGIREADNRKAAQAAIGAVTDFFRRLGLPTSLGQSPIGTLSEEELTELALACSRNRSRTVGCFRPLGYSEMLAVYRAANRGTDKKTLEAESPERDCHQKDYDSSI